MTIDFPQIEDAALAAILGGHPLRRTLTHKNSPYRWEIEVTQGCVYLERWGKHEGFTHERYAVSWGTLVWDPVLGSHVKWVAPEWGRYGQHSESIGVLDRALRRAAYLDPTPPAKREFRFSDQEENDLLLIWTGDHWLVAGGFGGVEVSPDLHQTLMDVWVERWAQMQKVNSTFCGCPDLTPRLRATRDEVWGEGYGGGHTHGHRASWAPTPKKAQIWAKRAEEGAFTGYYPYTIFWKDIEIL